jgi:hypothetical protein
MCVFFENFDLIAANDKSFCLENKKDRVTGNKKPVFSM